MQNSKKTRVIATSVTGALHLNRNTPCQDYYAYRKGKNLVAVVSDGAGSAKYGRIGARIICETLCDMLKNISFQNADKHLKIAISSARNKLILHRKNISKSEKEISNFAATIIGVIYHKNKGLFFHIGDGAGIAIEQNYNNFVISRPENGSFSCETFFYTQDEWLRNLRLTSFNNASTIFLMSDGLTGFSFSPDFLQIEHNFIAPIDKFLNDAENKSKAIKALTNTLNAPKAQRINSDDKTLVWIKVD